MIVYLNGLGGRVIVSVGHSYWGWVKISLGSEFGEP